jgi:hypothetical protein
LSISYSRWAAIVEKEQDKGNAFSGDGDMINDFFTTRARSLRKELLPLDLATIQDFWFIISTCRRLIYDNKIAIDTMKTSSEWFFTGLPVCWATLSTMKPNKGGKLGVYSSAMTGIQWLVYT